jgi:hypothetical protein
MRDDKNMHPLMMGIFSVCVFTVWMMAGQLTYELAQRFLGFSPDPKAKTALWILWGLLGLLGVVSWYVIEKLWRMYDAADRRASRYWTGSQDAGAGIVVALDEVRVLWSDGKGEEPHSMYILRKRLIEAYVDLIRLEQGEEAMLLNRFPARFLLDVLEDYFGHRERYSIAEVAPSLKGLLEWTKAQRRARQAWGKTGSPPSAA